MAYLVKVLRWQQKDAQVFEEDLVILPGDTEIKLIPDRRAFVVKWHGSDRRLLYWIQEQDTSKDVAIVAALESAFNNAQMPMDDTVSQVDSTSPKPQAVQTPSPATQTPSTRVPAPCAAQNPHSVPASTPTPATHPSPSDVLARLLASIQVPPEQKDLDLGDVLVPAKLVPLLSQHPEMLANLYPFLPAGSGV